MEQPYLLVQQTGSDVHVEGCNPYRAGSREDGLFVEWYWDGETLIVANDRYGFYPAYYYTKRGCFAISTSIPQLLRLSGSADLNDVGLALFLRLGYFIGDHTAFRHIRALPPSAMVDWKNGNAEVFGHPVQLRRQQIARADAIDGYIAAFRDAIRQRVPDDRFATPLSGGRDSRHILLELSRLGYRPDWCITARTKEEEVHVAGAIAAALELEHTVVETEEYACDAELRKNLLTQFGTTEHGWVLAITDFLAGKVRVLYDGLAGDVLSAGHFLTKERLELFDTGRLAHLAAMLMPIELESALALILPSDMYRQLHRDAALAELENELKQHQEAANPVASYFLANRTRRVAALSPCCIYAQVGKVFCPYLDRAVYDLLGSLPAETFLDYTFHTEAIRRAYPRYSSVPFEAKPQFSATPTRKPMSAGASQTRRWRRFALQLLRYAYWGRPPRWVRTVFLLPRLLRCTSDREFCVSANWFLLPAVYLIQLERLCRNAEPDTTL